jgi:methyl-accepting chemotaxis protein
MGNGIQAEFTRRQYIVDWSYQIKFAMRLFMAVLAVAIATFVVAGVRLWTVMDSPELLDQVDVIEPLSAVSIALGFEVLISIPIILFFGIRQSHKVVGPMGRIKRTLETIGDGDFSPRIKLRDGDVLGELAQDINRMAEKLEGRFGKTPDFPQAAERDSAHREVL